jgi:flavorubredoxin
MLAEAWKRKGLIVGAPTYESSIFPPVHKFLKLAEEKKLKNRVVGIFGSFGWSSVAMDNIQSVAEKCRWKIPSDPLDFNGKPNERELKKGYDLGMAVAKKVKSKK